MADEHPPTAEGLGVEQTLLYGPEVEEAPQPSENAGTLATVSVSSEVTQAQAVDPSHLATVSKASVGRPRVRSLTPDEQRGVTLPPDESTRRAPMQSPYAEVTGDQQVHSLKKGDVLAGRYEIVGRLGSGSMGTVYRAEHVEIGKTVAVKVLGEELRDNREVAERFHREAQSASRIRSPHVVDITDFGKTADGAPFFVMEYLRGETLAERLLERGPMDWATLRPILKQVLAALAAAHDQGVVHRDVKPDNVMLCMTPRGEIVKVLDFGIAKLIDPDKGLEDDRPSTLTQTGMIVGTAAYMSPEQAQSQPLDHRTDLYAVGVILFQCLTGELPFPESGFMAMCLAHVAEPVPRLTARRTGALGDVPPTLDEVLFKAMAKDPDERYADAEVFSDAIENLEGSGPDPDGAGGLDRRMLAAVRGTVILIAVIVVILVIVVALFALG